VSKIREHQKNVAHNLAVPINKDDEFSASLEYLQLLKKQKEENARRSSIEDSSKTMKNMPSLSSVASLSTLSSLDPEANITIYQELPDALKPYPQSAKPTTQTATATAVTLIPADDVPYSSMKNGSKPTFREWYSNKTQKRHPFWKEPSEQDKKLAELKEKIRTAPIAQATTPLSCFPGNFAPISIAPISIAPISNAPMSIAPISNPEFLPITMQASPTTLENAEISRPTTTTMSLSDKPSSTSPTSNTFRPPYSKLNHIKKTKTKRVSLGKQEHENSVGVLLKNDYTRKQVQSAQKLLANKPMREIKEYLKEHNLIKVGTAAPPDVLRKLYESAMLAGEITNSNKDILLHNFLSDKDKET
jgi:hypothetical protein